MNSQRVTAVVIPVAEIEIPKLFHAQLKLKRYIDIAVSAALLLICAPLFLVIAAFIKLTSPGPVFYRQRRLMQHRRTFEVFKFRTMVVGADRMLENVIQLNKANGPLFKVENDPRITRVGRILRKTFADELPQLINVLRGEMSLVGPRPCLPEEEARMEPEARFRFNVPQGITGPWQVNGYHRLTFEEQLAVERDYVLKWSLREDFSIIWRTIPMVLGRKGC